MVACFKSLVGVILVAMLLMPLHAQETQSVDLVDEQIEQSLDSYLSEMGDDTEVNVERFKAIAGQVNQQTPPSTLMRVRSYEALMHFYLGETEQAFALSERLMALAQDYDLPDVTAEAVSNRVELLQAAGRQAEAYLLLNDVEIPLEQATLPRVRYYGHNLISRIYADWGNFEEALKHLILAQAAVNESDDARTALRRQYLNYSIAHIQSDMNQWDASLETIARGLAEAEQFNLPDNLPDLWLLKGYVEVSLENYAKAETSLRTAIDYSQQLNREDIALIALNNLGDLAIRQNDFSKASDYLNEALAEAERVEDTMTAETVRFNLGFVKVKQGDNIADGLAEMRSVLNYFRDRGNNKAFIELLGEMADAYQIAGEYQQQAQMLLQQREVTARSLGIEQQRNAAELQSLYDSKDKAQQIKLLQQENNLNQQIIEINRQQKMIWVLLGIVGVVVAILLCRMYLSARRANLNLKEANSRLADQTLRDPLTGLWNRRALQQEMANRTTNLQRRDDNPAQTDGLILLDIDFFKRINDRHGHAVGDVVLIEIGQRLQTICRDTDKLIRWGGEEFLFYIRDVDNQGLAQLSQRILTAIAERPITVDGTVIEVTTTAGFICLPFAGIPEDELDWEKALQLADMALYTGKAHGRNRACGITSLHVAYQEAAEALATDLSAALDKGWVTMMTIEGPTN